MTKKISKNELNRRLKKGTASRRQYLDAIRRVIASRRPR